MKNVLLSLVVCAALLATSSSSVLAQSKKKLDPSSLSCQDFTYGKKGKTQEVCCDQDTAGVTKPSGELVLFTSLKKKNRAAKKKAAKKGKKPPTKWKQLIKATKGVCPLGDPTPTPTPTPTPPSSGPLHWNFQGELNSVGKACFHIPEEFGANVLTGEDLWNFHCAGCHATQTAQLNRKYDFLRVRTSQLPMFLTPEEVPDADLVNITAYLNRFNPNECPE